MDRTGSKAVNEPMPSHVEDRHDGTSTTISADEERALVRKIDMRLIPTVWIMYLFSYVSYNPFQRVSGWTTQADLVLHISSSTAATLEMHTRLAICCQ